MIEPIHKQFEIRRPPLQRCSAGARRPRLGPHCLSTAEPLQPSGPTRAVVILKMSAASEDVTPLDVADSLELALPHFADDALATTTARVGPEGSTGSAVERQCGPSRGRLARQSSAEVGADE